MSISFKASDKLKLFELLEHSLDESRNPFDAPRSFILVATRRVRCLRSYVTFRIKYGNRKSVTIFNHNISGDAIDLTTRIIGNIIVNFNSSR